MKVALLYRGAALFLILGGTAVGCKSPQGLETDSLAAVQIKGHTYLEVARVTSEVFQKAGFEPVPLPANNDTKMMFDKQGTAGDIVLYGGWSGEAIWYRAKIRLIRVDADTQLVTCDAYRVEGRGSPHFEEEQKLSRLKRGSYQKLLDQVKASLESERSSDRSGG